MTQLSSIFGVVWLVALQFLSRGLTFCLNLAVVRSIEPAVFGIADVQSQFILVTVLSLSRDAFRRAFARCNVVTAEDIRKKRGAKPTSSFVRDEEASLDVTPQQFLSLSISVIPLGCILAVCTVSYLLFTSSQHERNIANYALMVILYGVAAVLELCSEPMFMIAQTQGRIDARVKAEGAGIACGCITTCVLVVVFKMSLVAFALGRCVHSLVMMILFLFLSPPSAAGFRSFHVKFTYDVSSWTNPQLAKLVGGFMMQSVWKWVLQAGERLILRNAMSLVNQASYAVVANLGSVVARILFQPIEEHFGLNLFSRILGDTLGSSASTKQQRDLQHRAHLCGEILIVIMKGMLYLGLIFVCFGTHYSSILLQILYGNRYGVGSEASLLLSYYCYYVFIMGMNGITEAFTSAVSTPSQMRRNSFFLSLFSISYIVISLAVVPSFGSFGLILANCCSMSMRIVYSLVFIHRFFGQYISSPSPSSSSPLSASSSALADASSSTSTAQTQTDVASSVICSSGAASSSPNSLPTLCGKGHDQLLLYAVVPPLWVTFYFVTVFLTTACSEALLSMETINPTTFPFPVALIVSCIPPAYSSSFFDAVLSFSVWKRRIMHIMIGTILFAGVLVVVRLMDRSFIGKFSALRRQQYEVERKTEKIE